MCDATSYQPLVYNGKKTYAKTVKYDFLHILDQIVRVEKLFTF